MKNLIDMVNNYTRLNQWRIAVCDSDLPYATKGILLTMSVKWMDKNLYCHPSMRTIAETYGCSTNTVNKHINIAKQEGWLNVQSKTGAKQGWRRNDYLGFVPEK